MVVNETNTINIVHSQEPCDQESISGFITDVANYTFSSEQPEEFSKTTSDQPVETCNAIEIDLELLENIKVKWTEDYTKYRSKLLQERVYINYEER